MAINEGPYGTPVGPGLFGLLHDHLTSWKLDLDVLGTQNRFRTTKIKAAPMEDVMPGRRPGWASTRNMPYIKYADRQTVEAEGADAALKYDPATPSIWEFTKEGEYNSWGVPRGYKIVLAGAIAHQILPDDHPYLGAAGFTKYNVAITQRKETEPRSMSTIDKYDPGNAMVDMTSFIDGDSLLDEDLVAWVSLGVMHLPNAEDIPVITNFGTSIIVKPNNYFDENPAFDLQLKDFDRRPCAPEVVDPEYQG